MLLPAVQELKMSNLCLFNSTTGGLAIAHNGNIVNATRLKRNLEQQGSIFQTTSDTEVLAHLLKKSNLASFEDRAKQAFTFIGRSFSP